METLDTSLSTETLSTTENTTCHTSAWQLYLNLVEFNSQLVYAPIVTREQEEKKRNSTTWDMAEGDQYKQMAAVR